MAPPSGNVGESKCANGVLFYVVGDILAWTDIFSTSRARAACSWMRVGEISLI
jgi:hypothetical protein